MFFPSLQSPRSPRLAPGIAALWLAALSLAAIAQDRPMVCSEGEGSFSARSAGGVTVTIGPARKSGFATRLCSAALSWKGGSLAVATGAGEVDLDAFGVDLGIGPLVAALAVRAVASDKLLEYQIYSLKDPARRLRTLTGGDIYQAADTDLDGRVEIWTSDAAAIDGFERLSLASYDAAPTLVLRFEKGRLLDVSAEFQADYDRQIAARKAELNTGQLSRFKASDGRIADRSALSAADAHALMDAKIKVLEIVWAYLYSGREEAAWSTLAAMWPDADRERIRKAIVTTRASGMHSRVDGTSAPESYRRKHAAVFEAEFDYGKDDPLKSFQVDAAPQEILLRRPPLDVTAPARDTRMLSLVVDAAGKVHTPKLEGRQDKDLLASTAWWKFIPGSKFGHPVASRIRLGVSALQ